ncbi:hypothetical protein PVAP13_8KG252026 [Panicum virgatum]|uniref:Uncharacterized protein n=1 Tax=Panicum virgatum TaxID=38727 RepID=A0A8T0Q1B2_PANVG|nr:hypothetical protein PVAP13_8KG252026 [Panicum virgatum]
MLRHPSRTLRSGVGGVDGVLEAGGGREQDEDLLIPGGVLAAVEVDAGGAANAGVVAPVDVLEIPGRAHGHLHLVARPHLRPVRARWGDMEEGEGGAGR